MRHLPLLKLLKRGKGLKIACIEEIAYEMGYINEDQLRKLAGPLMKSGYGKYLIDVLEKKVPV